MCSPNEVTDLAMGMPEEAAYRREYHNLRLCFK